MSLRRSTIRLFSADFGPPSRPSRRPLPAAVVPTPLRKAGSGSSSSPLRNSRASTLKPLAPEKNEKAETAPRGLTFGSKLLEAAMSDVAANKFNSAAANSNTSDTTILNHYGDAKINVSVSHTANPNPNIGNLPSHRRSLEPTLEGNVSEICPSILKFCGVRADPDSDIAGSQFKQYPPLQAIRSFKIAVESGDLTRALHLAVTQNALVNRNSATLKNRVLGMLSTGGNSGSNRGRKGQGKGQGKSGRGCDLGQAAASNLPAGKVSLPSMWVEALELLQLMSLNGEATETSCNTAIKACSRALRPEEGEKVMRNMAVRSGSDFTAVGLAPSVKTYSILISGYGSVGRWKDCVRLFEEVIDAKEGMRKDIDVILYSAVLSGLARGCEGKSLAQDGIVVDRGSDVENYTPPNIMLIASSEPDQISEKAAEIFKLMDGDPARSIPTVRKDTISYSAMLHICERLGDVEQAFSLLDKMKETGIPRDVVVYNMLLACVAKRIQMMQMRKVEKQNPGQSIQMQMPMENSEHWQQPEQHVGKVNHTLLLQKVRSILLEMERLQIQKTAITLNAAIRSFEVAEDYSGSLDLLMKFFVGGNNNNYSNSSIGGDSNNTSDKISGNVGNNVKSPFASARPNVITDRMLEAITERLEMKNGFVAVGNSSIHESSAGQNGQTENLNNEEEQEIACAEGIQKPITKIESVLDPKTLQNLETQMETLLTDLSPTKSELQHAASTESRFREIVRSVLNSDSEASSGRAEGADKNPKHISYDILPYGSLVFDGALRGGDLDITVVERSRDEPADNYNLNQNLCVKNSNDPLLLNLSHLSGGMSRSRQQQLLGRLVTHLPGVVQIGLGGRIPVVQCRVEGDGEGENGEGENQIHNGQNPPLEVDVTVMNLHGVRKTEFIKEWVEAAGTTRGPNPLKEALLVVKHWAKRRRISGQTEGKLGGYSFTLMLLYYWQILHSSSHHSISMKKNQALPSAATVLSGFFNFYAREFGWDREMILLQAFDDTDTKSKFTRQFRQQHSGSAHSSGASTFYLRDPIETDWNLGAILDQQRLAELRSEFDRAWRVLDAKENVANSSSDFLLEELLKRRDHWHGVEAGSE